MRNNSETWNNCKGNMPVQKFAYDPEIMGDGEVIGKFLEAGDCVEVTFKLEGHKPNGKSNNIKIYLKENSPTATWKLNETLTLTENPEEGEHFKTVTIKVKRYSWVKIEAESSSIDSKCEKWSNNNSDIPNTPSMNNVYETQITKRTTITTHFVQKS